LWQMTQVMGPLLNSSFRALLNSGVDRRVMLFRFFSDALGCACGCLHVTGRLGAVIAPHSSTYEVRLPEEYTKGRTPVTFVTFGRCTPCSMAWRSTHVPVCDYQQSTTPYVAVRLSVVCGCYYQLLASVFPSNLFCK
jgi:hypothetical protein